MPATDLEPYTSNGYTPEIIEASIHALAAAGGNSRLAHEALQRQGTQPPPMRTLRSWITRYPNRYQAACERIGNELEDLVITQARGNAVYAGQIQRQLLDRLQQQVSHMNGKDAAAALQKLAISKGVDIDKTLTLTGRPSQVTEHRSADELLRKLQSLKVRAIDSTAVETNATGLLPDSAGANARELPAATTVD